MLSASHSSIWGFAGILFGLVFLTWLARIYTHPLRNVPGPFLARFSRLWELYEVVQGRFERTNVALHEKYGNSNGNFRMDEDSANTAIFHRPHRPLGSQPIQH